MPRVVMGRLILALAHWRVSKAEIKRLSAAEGAARFQAAQQWRAERRLPRWVALADGDNLLPLDLDNALSLETFIHLIKQREEAAVEEFFPGSDELCARGPEGRFVHELVVPFVRKDEGVRMKGEEKNNSFLHPSSLIPHPSRRFPPGSEWLYAKLYTGTAVADQVLREVVRPLTKELRESGAIERWFFIRYGDPDWHLRLRFHGAPGRLPAEALPALQAAVAPLLTDGQLSRVQLDTYEREVERYGGAEGIQLAERLFYADSAAVLEIIELLEPGDAGLDERWRLVLRGIDGLLDDLGFDLRAKHRLLDEVRKSLAKEFRADEQLIGQLGDRFRQERKALTALLDPAYDAESPLQAGIGILKRRSRRWASTLAELKSCAQAGRLSAPLSALAASYMHMHANRLLRSAQRAQEMVLYDFLARLYESQLARVAAGANAGTALKGLTLQTSRLKSSPA